MMRYFWRGGLFGKFFEIGMWHDAARQNAAPVSVRHFAAQAHLQVILEKAVGGVVGANLFARTIGCMRINSHLQGLSNILKQHIFSANCFFWGYAGATICRSHA
ncbi:MAG: hypothetical protein Q8J90_09140 [Gallionella sp.]|nr:hypothetical protein [Gallionella sp.]